MEYFLHAIGYVLGQQGSNPGNVLQWQGSNPGKALGTG